VTEDKQDTGLRWIALPGGCKPSMACSTDETRPRITHGYLRRRDDELWLYATDSFIAVGLKVEGNATEGWVPRPALEALERGAMCEQITPTAWRVREQHAVVTYDIGEAVVPNDKGRAMFPPMDSFLHDEREPSEVSTVAFDPALTVRLAEALGARRGVSFHFGSGQPVRVSANGRSVAERIGVQMPVRADLE
jgi:hypothetical protein